MELLRKLFTASNFVVRVFLALQKAVANPVLAMTNRDGCLGVARLIRDGETTIKIKFSHLRGGGPWGQRGKIAQKRLFSWETPRQ